MRSDLLLFLLLVVGQQMPAPDRLDGPAAPVNDPITVRGCLDGRFLRIVERDSNDLSRLNDVRLRGPRGVMRMLDDHRHDYVEITGRLDLGRPNRLETRRRVKIDSKSTISIVTSDERTGGRPPMTGGLQVDEPVLVVERFTPLGERCPSH